MEVINLTGQAGRKISPITSPYSLLAFAYSGNTFYSVKDQHIVKEAS